MDEDLGAYAWDSKRPIVTTNNPLITYRVGLILRLEKILHHLLKQFILRFCMVFPHLIAGATHLISHGTHKSKITIDVNHPKSLHLGIPA